MPKNRKTTSPAVPVIVLTGGGSGGHITPVLSLAHELRKQLPAAHLVYIGLKAEKIGGLQKRLAIFDQTFAVDSGKLRRYHGRGLLKHLGDIKSLGLNTLDGLKLLRGFRQSYRILGRLKADVVFSKGGYVAVPVGLAARSRKIPIITHDSDTVPGLANRIVGRSAAINATGMPPKYYDYPAGKIRYIGVPVEARIKLVTAKAQQAFKKQLGLQADGLALLVSGGGLGSASLNNLLQASVSELLRRFPKLHIFLFTGHRHFEVVKAAFRRSLSASDFSRMHIADFTQDYFVYSGASDLIVSRAGATSIAEFAVQAKACIVIPAPWIPGGQQIHNAKALLDQEAAVVIDNEVSPADFTSQVSDLLNDGKERRRLAQNLHGLAKPEATQQLAKLIIDLVTRS